MPSFCGKWTSRLLAENIFVQLLYVVYSKAIAAAVLLGQNRARRFGVFLGRLRGQRMRVITAEAKDMARGSRASSPHRNQWRGGGVLRPSAKSALEEALLGRRLSRELAEVQWGSWWLWLIGRGSVLDEIEPERVRSEAMVGGCSPAAWRRTASIGWGKKTRATRGVYRAWRQGQTCTRSASGDRGRIGCVHARRAAWVVVGGGGGADGWIPVVSEGERVSARLGGLPGHMAG